LPIPLGTSMPVVSSKPCIEQPRGADAVRAVLILLNLLKCDALELLPRACWLISRSCRRSRIRAPMYALTAVALLAFFWLCIFRVGSDLIARKAAFPVWSTTRVKSAIVVSLMVDGSASPDCRIFGRFRPVKMVSKRGAIPHQSDAAAAGKSSGPRTHQSRCRSRAALRPGTFTPRCSFGGTVSGEVPRVHFYTSGRNQKPGF
jgi:hypothetical protein